MNVIYAIWNSISSGSHPGAAAFTFVFPPAARKTWARAFAVCRKVEAEHREGHPQGTPKLPRQSPVQVPPTSEIIVWANVSPSLQNTTCSVLVENLSEESNVEYISWRVAWALTHVQGGKVPNPYPIHLPLRQALATVTAIDPQNIYSQNELTLDCTAPGVVEVDVRPIQADTSSNSPLWTPECEGLTPEQSTKFSTLLAKWKGVFVADEEDMDTQDFFNTRFQLVVHLPFDSVIVPSHRPCIQSCAPSYKV